MEYLSFYLSSSVSMEMAPPTLRLFVLYTFLGWCHPSRLLQQPKKVAVVLWHGGRKAWETATVWPVKVGDYQFLLPVTNLKLVVHCKHFFKEMQNIAQLEVDDGTNNQVHNWFHVSSKIVRSPIKDWWYLAKGEIVGCVTAEVKKLVIKSRDW